MPSGAPRAEPLQIALRPERSVVVVELVGELDLAGVPAVHAQLTELRDVGFEHIAVDLRGLGFLDSSGVALLLRWSSAGDGTRFSVVAGGTAVQRVLELTGADAMLDLVTGAELAR